MLQLEWSSVVVDVHWALLLAVCLSAWAVCAGAAWAIARITGAPASPLPIVAAGFALAALLIGAGVAALWAALSGSA